MVATLSRSATKKGSQVHFEIWRSIRPQLAETSSDVIQESVVSNFFYVIFHFLLFCYLYSQGFIHPSLPLISFKLRCVSRDWLLSFNRDCVPSMRRYKASHPPWAISSCMWWWIYSERSSGQACNIAHIIIYMMVVDTLKDYTGNLVGVFRQKGNVLLVIYSRRKSKLI